MLSRVAQVFHQAPEGETGKEQNQQYPVPKIILPDVGRQRAGLIAPQECECFGRTEGNEKVGLIQFLAIVGVLIAAALKDEDFRTAFSVAGRNVSRRQCFRLQTQVGDSVSDFKLRSLTIEPSRKNSPGPSIRKNRKLNISFMKNPSRKRQEGQ